MTKIHQKEIVLATYTDNGMEFEDMPDNRRCVRLTAVREPANKARVLTIPDRQYKYPFHR